MQMLIKGIRSFSPDNTHVIEFYKPLTLIVGHNGAGKTVQLCLPDNLEALYVEKLHHWHQEDTSQRLTQQDCVLMQTIIECLKQATTGELPPNTRSGQSFIHDPKASHHCTVSSCCTRVHGSRYPARTGMSIAHEHEGARVMQVAGELEVKAQIKLRINTATQQPVVIIRSFQVLIGFMYPVRGFQIACCWAKYVSAKVITALTFSYCVQLTQKKTTLQFKALDQTLQTINRETNQKEALTYRCADMDRIVPSLMGVSKVQACVQTLFEQEWIEWSSQAALGLVLHVPWRRCRNAAGDSRQGRQG